MRFQPRDGEILKAIFDNDGVLGKRHLKNWFWPDKTWRAMEQRLSKLYRAGYISWPSRDQRKNYPIPEPVCWLGWKGALYIAELFGVDIVPPANVNENQLRIFQRHLRQNGIRWVREPRWSMLRHDLAVTDFRVAVTASLGQLPGFTLRKWVTESEFRSNMDKVMFRVSNGDGSVRTIERGICPDAYFEIVNEEHRARNEPHKIRLLLELDLAPPGRLGHHAVEDGLQVVASLAPGPADHGVERHHDQDRQDREEQVHLEHQDERRHRTGEGQPPLGAERRPVRRPKS